MSNIKPMPSSDADYQMEAGSFKETFIANFHNVWFASVMGCGISANLLYKFPYPARCLEILGLIMFVITVLLFVLHNTLFVLKNFVYYRDWTFITDVKQVVFLGCYSMGFSTIINTISYITTDSNNPNWFRFVYVLFWFDVLFSVSCAWCISFYIYKKVKIWDFQQHGLNATLMLPLTTMTVTASTGGVIFNQLPDNLKLFHLILCFMLWANTMSLAFPYMTIYIAKLYITKLPPNSMIFSTFIPIGLMGQGTFGIILFGNCSAQYLSQVRNNFSEIFQLNGDAPISIITTPVQIFCILIAFFLLSFGYVLTFFGVSSVLSAGLHQRFTKNWWALTFPLGTMATGNAKLGELYHLKFFKIMGCIYAVCTILITLVCLVGSSLNEFPHEWCYNRITGKAYHTRTAKVYIDNESDITV